MKLMITPTFSSPGTPLILRTSDYFKTIQKVMVCGLSPKQHSQEPHQSLGLYEHPHQTKQTCTPKYNKFYYVIDEQWLKLTAHDMRSALVDMKLENRVLTQLIHPHLPCPISVLIHHQHQ